jgi:porin
LPGIDPILKPWYDLKEKAAEAIGLRYGIAWTPVYQVATSSLDGDDMAAGGIFEILVSWDLLDRGGSFPGTLGFRLEDRHRLGTDLAPQFLFAGIGTAVPLHRRNSHRWIR